MAAAASSVSKAEVNFVEFTAWDPEDKCVYCHETFLSDRKVMAHDGKDALHKKCLDLWIAYRQAVNLELNCMTCTRPALIDGTAPYQLRAQGDEVQEGEVLEIPDSILGNVSYYRGAFRVSAIGMHWFCASTISATAAIAYGQSPHLARFSVASTMVFTLAFQFAKNWDFSHLDTTFFSRGVKAALLQPGRLLQRFCLGDPQAFVPLMKTYARSLAEGAYNGSFRGLAVASVLAMPHAIQALSKWYGGR